MGALNFLKYRARRSRERGVDRWRSGSRRTVAVPPDSGIGVGNMFTFWLWAHHGRLIGEDRWVRRTEAMEPWLEVFPDVRPLLIDPKDMHLRDRRDPNWYQHFDAFPYESMADFIRTRLLSSPQLAHAPSSDTTVTVNVRRGDYYSNADYRRLYGFDIATYVAEAVAGAAAQGPITNVDVVSDDPFWCERHLGFLGEFGRLSVSAPHDGPMDNLQQLSSARRLILSNSSFSYWAAYLSNVRHGDNFELVWAPSFHRRGINGGRAFQLDPRWSVVENGGDDAPPAPAGQM